MNTRWKIALGTLLTLVVLGGAGLWWFFRDDAPPAANLESAVAAVNEGSTATTSAATTATSAAGTSAAGTWVVDADTGTFDYESATGTFAGFRIQENLSSIGSTTAVGRTGDVTGTVTIEGSNVTAASFTVDVSSITTNENRRDDEVQEALETDQFSIATFTLTQPIVLGDAATAGDAVSVTAVGDLTIHGVTEQVEFPLEAQLTKGTLVVVGSLDVTFSDFGVSVPTSPVVLSVDDHGELELQVLLTK
jgi:polyisoprenoid-binding protein YceI